jgi:hypothetical protein
MKKIWTVLYILMVLHIIAPAVVSAQANSGWFLPAIYSHTDEKPEAAAVGDVNNDGLDDIVVTTVDSISPYTYSLLVYIQRSDGKLNNYTRYFLPSSNHASVDIGDLNNDGLNDVAVSAETGIAVFYQDGLGGLGSPVLFNSSESIRVQVGDLNNDGLTDVAAIGWSTWDVDVFLQDGAGSLNLDATYTFAGQYYKDIEIADMNSDGLNDIVVAGDQGNTANCFAILYQNAGNTFDPAVYQATTFLIGGFAVADLNNDTLNDVVTSSYSYFGTHKVEFHAQNALGTLDPAVSYEVLGTPNHPVEVADVDRDGLPDAIISQADIMTVLFQQPDGTLGTLATNDDYLIPYAVGPNAQCMTTGDVNNDGREDVVIANYNQGTSILYGWNGDGALVVQTPNGHNFFVGTDEYISWESIGYVGLVDLYYSLDGGATWKVIATDQGSSPYRWTLPYTPASDCLVRVASHLGPAADSKIFFSILDDYVDRIVITSPNGGETLVAGNVHEINWVTTGSVGDVQIEYSTDNGGSWTEIAASTANDYSYDWAVPNAPSSQCLIRITDVANGAVADTSDSTFSIAAPGTEVITVTSPNGGEGLTGGSTYPITWTSTGTIPNVLIEYSTDNGSNWTSLGAVVNSGASGSYSWNVPNVNSSLCLVRISDAAQDRVPTDQSNSTFTIGSFGDKSITVAAPNGGELWVVSSTPFITWNFTGLIPNVRLQYSLDNGTSWTTIVSSTANNGSYPWSIPNVSSTRCLVRVTDTSDPGVFDQSNAVFTIQQLSPGLYVTSPKSGDYWAVGSTHDITWNSSGTVGNVKIQYSYNNKSTWNTITASTANDGVYSWTVPNTPSSQCYIKISEAADGSPYTVNYSAFSIVTGSEGPEISVNHSQLYYGCLKYSKAKTPIQTLIVNNSGYGVLKWRAAKTALSEDDSLDWLYLYDTSGTHSDTIDIGVDPFGLAPGTYNALITISSADATNSPQTVSISMKIYEPPSETNPFGSFDTPVHGSTVRSSIPVTGWALDDIGIDRVIIRRNAVAGEGTDKIYIGDAVLVEGARPDVELAYPGYPMNYKAGWGYMMLTNMLPNGGNGPFTIYAYARDFAGHEVLLGSKTVTCDNAHAVKPFGAIDTPAQGGGASGSNFRNQGWVLTPMPNKIPVNGSTIKVYIDGQNLGNPIYNIYRSDIAGLFPGYANSNGAMAYFDFDTGAYVSGIHTIQWTAADNAGNTDGIGSRYFVTLQNSGYPRQSAQESQAHTGTTPPKGKTRHRFFDILRIPVNRPGTVKFKKGYGKNEPGTLTADREGMIHITVPQDQRIVLHLGRPNEHLRAGYLVNGSRLQRLPIGSSLNRGEGIFYWQVSPGYFGKYRLVFILEDQSGQLGKQVVHAEIVPKFRGQ